MNGLFIAAANQFNRLLHLIILAIIAFHAGIEERVVFCIKKLFLAEPLYYAWLWHERKTNKKEATIINLSVHSKTLNKCKSFSIEYVPSSKRRGDISVHAKILFAKGRPSWPPDNIIYSSTAWNIGINIPICMSLEKPSFPSRYFAYAEQAFPSKYIQTNWRVTEWKQKLSTGPNASMPKPSSFFLPLAKRQNEQKPSPDFTLCKIKANKHYVGDINTITLTMYTNYVYNLLT